MVQARMRNGQLELLSPLPEEWEGCLLDVNPSQSNEPNTAELKRILSELHAMGPMEFDPGEYEEIQREWKVIEDKDREQMRRLIFGDM